MVAGYRDDGICPGLFSRHSFCPPYIEEFSSLHVAPRHGAVISLLMPTKRRGLTYCTVGRGVVRQQQVGKCIFNILCYIITAPCRGAKWREDSSIEEGEEE